MTYLINYAIAPYSMKIFDELLMNWKAVIIVRFRLTKALMKHPNLSDGCACSLLE